MDCFIIKTNLSLVNNNNTGQQNQAYKVLIIGTKLKTDCTAYIW